MQRQTIIENGVCQASIKTEQEIQAIQRELGENFWINQVIIWIEAIKDPTRFKLVCLLYRFDRLCVCDLANILNISSSAVSQHLRKLKDMGLVTASRNKQTFFYKLDNPDFVVFLKQLTHMEQHYDER